MEQRVAQLEKAYTQSLHDIARSIHEVHTNEAMLIGLVVKQTEQTSRIEGSITDIKGDIGSLKSDVASLQVSVVEMKSDIASLKTGIASILEILQKRNS